MRKLLIVIIYCFSGSQMQAQQWYPLAGGLSGGIYSLEADAVRNRIYASGMFGNSDTLYGFEGRGQWDGTSWSHLKLNQGEIGSGPMNRLRLIDDTLYMGGIFPWPNNNMAILPMNGGYWRAHSPSSNFLNYTTGPGWFGGVDDFIKYQGNLYAVGGFRQINFNTPNFKEANNIAKWNGSSWETMGSPPGVSTYAIDDMSFVRRILEYNNELYVVGKFDSIAGVEAYNVAKWDGTTWSALGTPPNQPPPDPGGYWSAVVYNGSLYIGGNTLWLYKWDGVNWSILTLPNNVVTDMIVYGGELIVGGAFTSIGGIAANGIARYNGLTWNAFGTGLASPFPPAYPHCFAVLNNELYVGGAFDNVDGVPALGIARYGWPLGLQEQQGSSLNMSLNSGESNNYYLARVYSDKAKRAVLKIYDTMGKEVSSQKQDLAAGENTIRIELEHTSPGFYIVNLQTDDTFISKKLIRR